MSSKNHFNESLSYFTFFPAETTIFYYLLATIIIIAVGDYLHIYGRLVYITASTELLPLYQLDETLGLKDSHHLTTT